VPAPVPGGGGAADLASADTHKSTAGPLGGPPSPPGGRGAAVPPPPGAPGAPGAPARPGPPRPPDPSGTDDAGAYVPTQTVDPDIVASLRNPGQPTPPQSPGAPPQGPGAPSPGPGAPPPGQGTPPPPPGPSGYGYPQAGGYGYPPQAQPTVGSGYMAVLRYRAPDGSEQQLIRRSAPGMPHPEWQILHELYAMNVPPQQVIELHTELQSCELPGGYCARMIRETWPQVRITHTAAYGRDLASRQAGVRHLVEHQDELQQFADGPQRSAPVRAPLPQQHPAPAVGLDVIGQELAQAFGPQGVFRYTPQTVSRHGVPEIVQQTLLWSGLPLEIGPFFWAQAQPGRPVPTLAEVAMERGVQPSPDAGSYLVMGTDFGRQICVQYGTAAIVAVPLEIDQGGPVPPQFVNASLPQFARCMALLGRMWRLRLGLNSEQAGRWTTDFQAQLASLDPMAVADPESWWSVLLEQMWDGLL
ncbi:SUKH-4 family immunity protein, partial [Streptomyces sp. PT12]|uniref:SUKH-4 family immunity protein n=1 Tax=Streptomyces sp. PT12 TaxID=1510197 RepID=UPI000E079215